ECIPEGAAMAPFHETVFGRPGQFTPDALIVCRANRIVLVNDRAEAMFGYSEGELRGRALGILVPERCRALCAGLVAGSAHALAGVGRGLTGLRKDGREFPAEVTFRQVEAGGEPLVALAVRDASERRRAEDSLKARVRQQALVAELGRRALTGIDLRLLM